MKFHGINHRFTRFSVILLITVATLFLSVGEAAAFLHRVGPLNPAASVGNFPAWFQDNTGLALEFCDPKNQAEVDGGWCLLLPGDVVVPEVFPTNFFDEHFWYAADAGMDLGNGGRALLVLAVEAAFSAGVEPGGQIAFSRIRVRLDPVPVTGTYRFIHPYGEEITDAVAGDRIFITDDVGIACPPGHFECALDSRLGPFLLPSSTPGGAEMPPLTATNQTPDDNAAHFPGGFTAYPANGKSYIADPAREGPVTGSPLPNFIDSTGASRNHNIFRIEGPAGSNLDGAGNDYIETTNFTLVGRIFTDNIASLVTVDRANYARNGAGRKVEVFATGFETTQGRLPANATPPAVLPQLSFFDAPCGLASDNVTYIAPTGATETQMVNDGHSFWAQTQPAAIPVTVCVKDNVSNFYFPKAVGDEVTVTEAFFDNNTQTLSVKARSSDQVAPPTLTLGALGDLTDGAILVSPLLAPPATVRVHSSAGGVNEFQVTTNLPPAVDNVTLATSPASPQLAGPQVLFVATASGGSGTYEYQFSQNVGGVLTVERPYNPSPGWLWNTTGLAPNTYNFRVDARSVGSINASEASAVAGFVIGTPPPATGATLATSPTSPQSSGTPVMILATGSGGSGIYEYQFTGMPVVRPYSTTAGLVWDTTGVPNGTYTIKVDVRSLGSTSPSEASASANYVIGIPPPPPTTGVTLTANPASPQLAGTNITFTAGGSGGSGTYEYEFWLLVQNVWTMIRPYSTDNTWTWTAVKGRIPDDANFITVYVRSAGSAAAVEAFQQIAYTVNASAASPATGATLAAAPTTAFVGDNVVFTASGIGGTGTYEFQFLELIGGVWTVVQPYSATNTWTWNTVGATAGTHFVTVYVRSAGSASAVEAFQQISYVLQ